MQNNMSAEEGAKMFDSIMKSMNPTNSELARLNQFILVLNYLSQDASSAIAHLNMMSLRIQSMTSQPECTDPDAVADITKDVLKLQDMLVKVAKIKKKSVELYEFLLAKRTCVIQGEDPSADEPMVTFEFVPDPEMEKEINKKRKGKKKSKDKETTAIDNAFDEAESIMSEAVEDLINETKLEDTADGKEKEKDESTDGSGQSEGSEEAEEEKNQEDKD